MTGTATPAARFWQSLLGSGSVSAPLARGQAGYGFWQRYWASLTGAGLSVRSERGIVTAEPVAPRMAEFSGSGRSWFRLPDVPQLGVLAAAGEAAAVVVQVAAPDGRAEFLLRREGADRYRLEVVVRSNELVPCVVTIRYGHPLRALFIPVTRSQVGSPSSSVSLPGLDRGMSWEASGPRVPGMVDGWTEQDIAASIGAALTTATRAAWMEIKPVLPVRLQQVIDGALE